MTIRNADGHFIVVNESQMWGGLDGPHFVLLPSDDPMTFQTIEAAAESLVYTAQEARGDPLDPGYLGLYMLVRINQKDRDEAVKKAVLALEGDPK